MVPHLPVYQALWAMEHRRPGEPQASAAENFDRVKAAGFDGMAIDLGALTFAQAQATVPHFSRTGLGGLLTARDQSIPSALASLDQLAYGIATQVNTVNNAGTDLDGDAGNAGNIFNAPTQVAGSAAAMAVVMTDPNKIAAAGLNLGTGDDSNAVAAANLATQSIINGQTPSDFYSNLVSTLGATVSETTTQNTALTASVSQLQSQVNSLSGVNLNDEASNLEQFQRAYQAASQVFSILNTVYAAAINIGVETAVS